MIAYRLKVEQPERRRPLGRPRRRWVDNITETQDVEVWNGLNWLKIGAGGGLFFSTW
jgi:hypothetical protein